MLTILITASLFIRSLAYHQVVDQLQNYIDNNATFAKLVNQTLVEASENTTITYEDMYIFFDSYISIIGNCSNNTFQTVLSQFSSTPTGSILYVEQKSQSWIMKYFMAKKEYANSYNSTSIVAIWESWYKINMSEYIIPQNGYQSFNDFFTRKIKDLSTMRPISQPQNNSFITSPCDGIVDWIETNLSANTEFEVKRNKYSLVKMLNNNEYYIDKFIGGSAMDIMLHQYNYHRYHSSVSGFVEEIDIIGGYILVNAPLVNESIIDFYANNNVRGITYINTENFGYIAQIYVGMQMYNSINFGVSAGVFVNKGDEIGYFMYGGSSIVILFEKNIKLDFVRMGDTVQMGQRIGTAYTNDIHKYKNEL